MIPSHSPDSGNPNLGLLRVDTIAVHRGPRQINFSELVMVVKARLFGDDISRWTRRFQPFLPPTILENKTVSGVSCVTFTSHVVQDGCEALVLPRKDNTDDTVFKVDPITRFCLDKFPTDAPTQVAQFSVFTDSVPADHAYKVLLAYSPRVTAPLGPEQGPDLVSDILTMDDATLTTLTSLSDEGSLIALLDAEPLQSFIYQGDSGRSCHSILCLSHRTQIMEWVRLLKDASSPS